MACARTARIRPRPTRLTCALCPAGTVQALPQPALLTTEDIVTKLRHSSADAPFFRKLQVRSSCMWQAFSVWQTQLRCPPACRPTACCDQEQRSTLCSHDILGR